MRKIALVLSLIVITVFTGCGSDKIENNEHQNEVVKEDALINVYTPAEKFGFEVKEAEIEKLNSKDVLNVIKETGIIPEECELKGFGYGVGKVYVDMNEAFEDYIKSLGVTEEYFILGSFVNTYLDAYEVEEIKITIEGEDLKTDHGSYARFLKKYEW